VTKDELIDIVWGGALVHVSNITKHVAEIRRVLRPGFRDDDPVTTIWKVGYRFNVLIVREQALGHVAEAEAGYRMEGVESTPIPFPEPAISDPPPVTPTRAPFFSNRHLLVTAAALALIVAGGIAFGRLGDPLGPHFGAGAGMVRLTHTGSIARAAVSPDGRLFGVFTDEQGDQVLRICETASGHCPIVLKDPGTVLKIVFAPEAKAIFFGSENGLAPGNNIYRLPERGGPPVVVVRGTANFQDVSADGQRMIYLRSTEQQDTLYMLDSPDSTEREVVNRFRPDRVTAAAFSPDQSKVAFWWLLVNSENSYVIATVPATGGAGEPISPYRWPVTYPRPVISWATENNLTVLIRDPESGLRQIYRVTLPDASIRRISSALASWNDLSVVTGTGGVVSIRDDTTFQVWVSEPGDVGRLKQVTTGRPGYQGPHWMPDGNLLVGGNGLWKVNLASGGRIQVPGTTPFDENSAMTPDGRELLFQSTRQDESAVWRMDTGRTIPVQLTHRDNGSRPDVSPDGRWFTYSGFAEDGIAIWKMATSGGDPIRVSRDVLATEPRISPDQKWVAGSCSTASRLKLDHLCVFPFEGGPPARMFPLSSADPRIQWSPDGTAIDYVIGNILWRQPLDGSPLRQITHFEREVVSSFDWSRDGRLAVAMAIRTADAVLIRNERN
jgi:Tol biopolymer transport system component